MVHRSINIESIPYELLVDILGRVGSSSFTDLFNTKLCCKDFKRAAEEESILSQICIKKFPMMHQWLKSVKVEMFIHRCRHMENPEALYRQGMVEYFTYGNTQSGLDNLKKAANKGHKEAVYVYGVLLLCMGGDLSIHGSELLDTIAKIDAQATTAINSMDTIQECRTQVKDMLGMMWINNHITDERTNLCHHPKTRSRMQETWKSPAQTDIVTRCTTCKWNDEVTFLCNMNE